LRLPPAQLATAPEGVGGVEYVVHSGAFDGLEIEQIEQIEQDEQDEQAMIHDEGVVALD